MTKQEFISAIAKSVQRYAPSYGISVHSPIIAQAILESDYGKSKLSASYHNYFGLKCGDSWRGKSVNMATKEEYQPGQYTHIRDNFRVYSNMDEGVKGYFEFIQYSRYHNLRGITDPETYLKTIKADGYATDSRYVSMLMQIIKENNLTQYDSKGGKSMVTTDMIIGDAVSFAIGIAKDNKHGYSQQIRSLYNITNPTSFDCSSLVLTAYYYAFKKHGLEREANYLKANCSYTGNMLKLQNVGFEVVATHQTAHKNMKMGDIELNTTYHTALAIDADNIVHARTSEGTRNTKDDSGNEIRTQAWYNYSKGWTHRLRFTGKGIDLNKAEESKPVKTSLNTTPKYKGKIKGTKNRKVRTWAGSSYPEVSFSPLRPGTVVEVCDTLKSAAGNKWYYIKTGGKYGFIYSSYVKKI